MTKSPGFIWRAASWALIVALGAPAWLTVVLILYPFCNWYNAYKSSHKQWWLSYL